MTVGELLLFLSGLPRDTPVLSDSCWNDVTKGPKIVITIDKDGVYIRHDDYPEEA